MQKYAVMEESKGEIKQNINSLSTQMTETTILSSQFSTLQNSFDNVLATKLITVVPGNYNISTPLTFKGGKNYSGYGVTIKALVNTAYITNVGNDITIEGFTFDGGNVLMRTFLSENCSNIKFVNCHFKNATKYSFQSRLVRKLRMENCTFSNGGRQDFMSSGCALNGHDIVLSNCYANDNLLGNGYMVYTDTNENTSDVTFDNCEANNNYGHGFASNSLSPTPIFNENISYYNCRAKGNGHDGICSGFGIHYVSFAILDSCKAEENKEHGIVLMDGRRFTVVNCKTIKNKYSGIRLQADWIRSQDAFSGVKNSKIHGCTISENGSYSTSPSNMLHVHNGILIEGNCHYIDVYNNEIINNNGRSVFVKTVANYTDCTNIYINDNTISGNTVSNDVYSTVASKSILGTNFISGNPKPIRDEENNALHRNIDLNTLAVDGTVTNLKIIPNALYRAFTGENFTISTVETTNYLPGTRFFVMFQSNSSNGSITINANDQIELPDTSSPFVISKANGRHAKIYEFKKVSGSKFFLVNS